MTSVMLVIFKSYIEFFEQRYYYYFYYNSYSYFIIAQLFNYFAFKF